MSHRHPGTRSVKRETKSQVLCFRVHDATDVRSGLRDRTQGPGVSRHDLESRPESESHSATPAPTPTSLLL